MSWATLFYAARFSAQETTAWERLVASGVSRDTATKIMLSIREARYG